jgi:hypothetical protein
MFREGLRAAKLEHDQAAEVLFVSSRTIGRYVAGDSVPPHDKLLRLSRAVAPHDGALASQLARAAGVVTQESTVSPAAPAAATATLDVPVARLVEVVVCAAADAIDAPPRTARAAIAAALVSARSLGLSIDAIIAALVPAK